ncbi:MAG: class II aldolase/adducin family protein [Bacteroidales bacterium]|nr:class II aldolase/adducin family protein [Bacteroidales bacterium]
MKKTTDNKKEVAYFMRRLYNKGLTTTSGGNVSCRSEEGTIYITPSQTDKGRIRKHEIAEITLEGINKTPELKPSMETGMHLAIYRKRPDVKAIVHAHPVFATVFAATGKTPCCKLSGEARAILGELQIVPYQLMGTENLAEKTAEALSIGNVAIMQNHGAIAIGSSLLEAFDRLEVLEATAKISFLTDLSGARKELSENEIEEIDRLMGNNK